MSVCGGFLKSVCKVSCSDDIERDRYPYNVMPPDEKSCNMIQNFLNTVGICDIPLDVSFHNEIGLWLSAEEYDFLVQNADLLEIEMIQTKEG
jgi:hypothetical protein